MILVRRSKDKKKVCAYMIALQLVCSDLSGVEMPHIQLKDLSFLRCLLSRVNSFRCPSRPEMRMTHHLSESWQQNLSYEQKPSGIV